MSAMQKRPAWLIAAGLFVARTEQPLLNTLEH
jgi:hypothetical protein